MYVIKNVFIHKNGKTYNSKVDQGIYSLTQKFHFLPCKYQNFLILISPILQLLYSIPLKHKIDWVKEFYAEAALQLGHIVTVRGVDVCYSIEAINNIYGLVHQRP